MVHVEKLNLKRTQPDFVIFPDDVDIEWRFVLEILLPFDNYSPGELRRVNRRIAYLGNNMRYGSDMIVMAVSDDHSPYFSFLAPKIAYVRDDVINARHVFLGKLQPHVDNDDVVAIFKDCHVAADFFESSQGYDSQPVAAENSGSIFRPDEADFLPFCCFFFKLFFSGYH